MDCASRLVQTRTSYHHLLTTHVKCSLHNIVKVIGVGLFLMVDSLEDSISQVDTNLQEVSVMNDRRVDSYTRQRISFLLETTSCNVYR